MLANDYQSMGDKTGVALAKTIEQNTTLHTIELGLLQEDNVGDETGVALAKSIEENTRLHTIMLDLDFTKVGDETGLALAKAITASQLFWSASQLFWSVRSRQCLLFGLDSQPDVVCFCCLVCFFGVTPNKPNSNNKKNTIRVLVALVLWCSFFFKSCSLDFSFLCWLLLFGF